LINILKIIDVGLIREPLDIDLIVDPRPLTEKDKKAISDFIKADKLKRKKARARSLKSRSARLKRTVRQPG
jgi:hypothetical protein